MQLKPRRVLAHTCALLTFAVAVFSPLRAAQSPDRAPVVILVSIDGLAAFNVDDPQADLPTLRWMAKEGVRAEGMETSFPSVTWPTHTALVTGVHAGRHGVIANAIYDRAQNKKVPLIMDAHFDKEDLVTAPTIYDIAHRAGLKTAGVNWPASRNARHLHWQTPDVGDQAIFEKAITPALLTELKAKGIPLDKQSEWAKGGMAGKPMRDWMYTRIASHILQTHKPNVLVLHLVSVDSASHQHGAKSAETRWAANDNDNRVRELVEAVKAAGLADRATFFVTADHGFADFSKNINLTVLLKNKGLMTVAGSNIVDRKVALVAEGGAGLLYITDTANRAQIMADLVPALKQVEGIEAVFPADEFASIGHAGPDKNKNAPDIIVAAAQGYSIAENPASKDLINPTGTVKGNHGNLPKHRYMDAAFIAWGAGIKPGAKLGRIRNVDVAPTMAAILGVKMENVEGRVLTEILKK
jgi:predicted AlkP superfamily pyrophosphatase or phosphodiesterase